MTARGFVLALVGLAAFAFPAAALGAVPPAQALPLSAAPRPASWPSGPRGRIVRAAASQLGYRARSHYCTKFGPCEAWCALFSTWAWQSAGIPIARYPFTGSIYYWAALNTRVLRPSATPRAGDAVLFGTGPRSVGSSLHVGIVERVFPGYLVTIEGDTDNRVLRLVVPTADPARVGEPGRVYAYASPLRDATGAGSSTVQIPNASAARALLASKPLQESRLTATDLRLRTTVRSLRAFQHMPYRAAGVKIGWGRVNSLGQIEVAVISHGPLASAQLAWQSFLARWGDPGTAYAVTFFTAG